MSFWRRTQRYSNSRVLLLRLETVDAISKSRFPETDNAVRSPCKMILENVSDTVSDSPLQVLRNDWIGLHTFSFEKNRLPLLFTTRPETVTNALSIVWPQLKNPNTKKSDKYGSFLTRPNSPPDPILLWKPVVDILCGLLKWALTAYKAPWFWQ